jgi:hypothetical protein
MEQVHNPLRSAAGRSRGGFAKIWRYGRVARNNPHECSTLCIPGLRGVPDTVGMLEFEVM